MSRRNRAKNDPAKRWPLGNVETTTPLKPLGHSTFLNDLGQTLEAKHVPDHDAVEVWIEDQWFVFRRGDKADARALADFLNRWAGGDE